MGEKKNDKDKRNDKSNRRYRVKFGNSKKKKKKGGSWEFRIFGGAGEEQCDEDGKTSLARVCREEGV